MLELVYLIVSKTKNKENDMASNIDTELPTEELERQIHEKNRSELKSQGGFTDLITYNLENFAYRYLETTTDKSLKAQINENDIYVTSIEPDIVHALKWENKELKNKLIALCKKYPGSKSKELKVKLTLGSLVISNNQVECYSEVNWDQDQFSRENQNYIEKRVTIKFDDPLELRNTHAKYLEQVSEIF